MAGLVSNRGGVSIRAGVQTAADVNTSPSLAASASGSSRLSILDTDSGSNSAVLLFVLAVIMLYIIL